MQAVASQDVPTARPRCAKPRRRFLREVLKDAVRALLDACGATTASPCAPAVVEAVSGREW